VGIFKQFRVVLPAKPFVVAIYLASLIQFSLTPSPVISAFYAITWFHDINGLKSPTESKLICNILESAKRRFSRPKDRKEPITSVSMYNRLYSRNHFKSQRIIVACLIAYAGFLEVRNCWIYVFLTSCFRTLIVKLRKPVSAILSKEF